MKDILLVRLMNEYQDPRTTFYARTFMFSSMSGTKSFSLIVLNEDDGLESLGNLKRFVCAIFSAKDNNCMEYSFMMMTVTILKKITQYLGDLLAG